MVDIRSASYTSSYSSPTLTIPAPATMVADDFLVCFLIALSQYSGNFYNTTTGAPIVVGNPPPGWGMSGIPPTGPPSGDRSHEPPVAVLHMTNFALPWSSGGNHGYTGNWWSNLGSRNNDGSWNTSGLSTWPWQTSWTGASRGPMPAGNANTGCMASVTAVGRRVTGTEPSSLTFTLNNPNDSEYDYRGVALCFTSVDWGGTYVDNASLGGLGTHYFTGNFSAWATIGTRAADVLTTSPSPGGRVAYVLGAGEYWSGGALTSHAYGINLRDLDAYKSRTFWSWPPDTDYTSDPSSPVVAYPAAPPDDLTTDDLILHLIAYAGPTSYGDPTTIVVSDQSATPPVSPLTTLTTSSWTKGSNTLLVRLSQTRATSSHATEASGSGIVRITSPVVAPEGPITLPSVTYNSNVSTGIPQIYTVGLALTFRVRRPYPAAVVVSIPSRLATIVG